MPKPPKGKYLLRDLLKISLVSDVTRAEAICLHSATVASALRVFCPSAATVPDISCRVPGQANVCFGGAGWRCRHHGVPF